MKIVFTRKTLIAAAITAGVLTLGGVASASYILLQPYHLMPGEELAVIGEDFLANTPLEVSVGEHTLSPITTSPRGSFTTPHIKIPNTGGGEPLPVTVREPSGRTAATSTVSVGRYYPFVAPNSYYVLPGGTVRFTGIHFAPNENVLMTGNNTATVVRADSNGSFETGPFEVGYIPANRLYRFTGTSSQASFEVALHVGRTNPWLTLDTYYALPGAPLLIHGHFFGLHEAVSLFFEGEFLGTAMTNSQGDFRFLTSVPFFGGGGYKVISARGLTTGAHATSSFSQAGF